MHATRVSVLVATATHAPAGAANTYLVTGGGDTPLVNPTARTDRLDDLVAREGVDHLAVTHTHADHVGVVAAYARETSATVWCHRGRERAFSTAAGVDPDRTFAEGATVPVGAGVKVLDTPGYARDHVSFAAGDDVLCGDLTMAKGSVVVGVPGGDVWVYLVALRRLRARGSEQLHPGHGPGITDLQAMPTQLVAHRNDRERAVLDAVCAGNATPDAVTGAAYDRDVSAVRDLARAAVVAHIEKLTVERRARRDPEVERVEPR